MNWQPIESAPKDGTRLILWCEYGCVLGFAHRTPKTRRLSWRLIFSTTIRPTHWMPLPEPPK